MAESRLHMQYVGHWYDHQELHRRDIPQMILCSTCKEWHLEREKECGT